jgi:peptidoglycan hydrolase-like protein with peptidoglycan-binding domain
MSAFRATCCVFSPPFSALASDSSMMNRFLLCFFAITLSSLSGVRADDTIRAVQTRLKAGGFYFGEINGRNDSDTTAAITRYQIRNGLQITGQLDGPTRHALGVAEGEPEVPLRGFGEEAWRSLRKTDQEYLKRLEVEENAAAPKPLASSTKTAPASTTPPAAPSASRSANYNRERLRDYIGAFVLAGLDPKVAAETEFFADRVNYFGKRGVTRETIRRDLQRYNDRWPQRAFTLAGDLDITPAGSNLKVTFPLRYDLRNGSNHSTGKVLKTLVLARAGNDDLEIVSVNERKL